MRGGLYLTWKCEQPVSYHKFHDILSWQMRMMHQWDPAHQLYPGDKNMRRVQQFNKSRRVMKSVEILNQMATRIMFPLLSAKRARMARIHDSAEILSEFRHHANGSILKQGTGGRGKPGLKCAIYHMITYMGCSICRIQAKEDNGRHLPLCFYPSNGPGVGNPCFLDYHNNIFFGLAKKDCNSVVKKHHQAEWVAPNHAKRDEHAMSMA
jgi:hypothetical protein